MKKLLLTSVASVALIAAGSANAADLRAPVYKGPPPVVAPAPPPFSWTGCFVGAHWGWGWGRKTVDESFERTDVTDADDSFSEFASGTMDPSGAIFGGQVGCDYQFGWGKGKGAGGPGGLNWVIGIQFDAAGTDINDERTDPSVATFGNQFDVAAGRIAVKQDWLASLTGRLGVTGFGSGFWSQTLWYVRGGVAWTRDRWDLAGTNEFFNDFPVFSPVNQTRTGWTIGVGWEWAFLPNWSAFVEWNHYDFGTKTLFSQTETFKFSPVGDTFTDNLAFDVKQTLETVKIGVNYRFNFGKAPGVVARY